MPAAAKHDIAAIMARLDGGLDIEAAELAIVLRRSRRWLRDFLSGADYGRMKGARRVFVKADVLRIIGEMPSCRSSSSRRKNGAAKTTVSGARTSASTWNRAQELLTKRSRGKSATKSAAKSNVVSFRRAAAQPS
jgi:hypothetical protein